MCLKPINNITNRHPNERSRMVNNSHVHVNPQENTKHTQTTINTLSSNTTLTTLLQTGYVWVCAEDSRRVCRILLDTGSQRNYVTESLAKWLNSTPVAKEASATFTTGGNIS